MNVNLAVCGLFHFRNYVRFLHSKGVLGTFYFSHKIRTGQSLNAPPEKLKNIYIKEYLTQAHGRALGTIGSSFAYPIYADLWTKGVLYNWRRSDVLHTMAHGFSAPIIRRARSEDTIIISEVVNTHPENQNTLVQIEAERWGIRWPKSKLTRNQAILLEEVGLADCVLAPTETVRRTYAERGFDSAKIQKIPFATDTSRFAPRTKNEMPVLTKHRPLKVICVGSIGIRKGQLNLLEASQRMGPNTTHVTLVGSLSIEVLSKIGKYNGQFTHIPRIANEDLRALLIKQDVFVLPSLEEGLALSLGEAMACGLPIVATPQSGAEELVTSGREGLFLSPGSVDSIVETLGYLNTHRELLISMGEASASRMGAQSSWENYAAQMITIYNAMRR